MFSDLNSNNITELLFENSEGFTGIFDVTADRFVRVNRAGAHMLGFASEEAFLAHPVLSRSLREQATTTKERANLIAWVIEQGNYKEITKILHRDGHSFWATLTVTVFKRYNQTFGLIRITDQERLHEAERALAHSVRRYEAIFSNATLGIIVCNQQGRIVSANQLADQLFGYETGELESLTIEQLVPAGVSHYHAKLRHSFNTHPQVRAMGRNRDLHAQRKDGTVFPVEISLSYFLLEEELYVVAYIIDITFKKEAERQLRDHRDRINADLEKKVADRTHALMTTLEQLEQSKDELSRALAAERELGELKSRFVSMASHEFRSPLTAVLTSASLVEKYSGADGQEKRQKHFDRIRASVNHLNDILEEFLSVGKLEEGKLEAHPAEVEVAGLVAETIADMQGMLKPGQTVQTQLACPHPVWLDLSLLRKILVNLLSNAVKYSGPGSVVTVSGRCAEGWLTLSVSDQGIGISKADQEHLFERFFRAANVTNISGTGLGLHIVGRYTELMGGQVALQSELNQGTTVTLTLPYENHSTD